MDERIGTLYLNPSPGFGGAKLLKDIQNLVYNAKALDMHEVAEYWDAVIDINNF